MNAGIKVPIGLSLVAIEEIVVTDAIVVIRGTVTMDVINGTGVIVAIVVTTN